MKKKRGKRRVFHGGLEAEVKVFTGKGTVVRPGGKMFPFSKDVRASSEEAARIQLTKWAATKGGRIGALEFGRREPRARKFVPTKKKATRRSEPKERPMIETGAKVQDIVRAPVVGPGTGKIMVCDLNGERYVRVLDIFNLTIRELLMKFNYGV